MDIMLISVLQINHAESNAMRKVDLHAKIQTSQPSLFYNVKYWLPNLYEIHPYHNGEQRAENRKMVLPIPSSSIRLRIRQKKIPSIEKNAANSWWLLL